MGSSATRHSRLRRLLGGVVTAACVAACGGDDTPTPPDSGNPPPSDGGVQVRGTERIGWLQQASSPQDLRAHTYRMYVDNSPTAIPDVACTEALTDGAYPCSGRLPTMSPGRHVLEITSIRSGVESGRSPALVVTQLASSQAFASGTLPAPGLELAPLGRCAPEPTGCSGLDLMASGLGPISALATLPDGRLLLAEGDVTIRIVTGRSVLDRAALVLDEAGVRVAGIAADTAFEQTRAVFVASVHPATDGEDEIRITRYRELGGTLAQGAVILSGMPSKTARQVPVAVDDRSLLYVGVPGAILRLTTDGYVPPSNARSSAVFARGYAEPTSLAVDAPGGRLWAAGRDPSLPHALSSVPLEPDASAGWPLQLRGALANAGENVTLAVLPEADGRPASLLIGQGRQVLAAVLSGGQPQAFEPIAQLGVSNPLVGDGAGVGARAVAVGATSDGRSVLLRLAGDSR